MRRSELSIWLLAGLALLLGACAVPVAVPLADREESAAARHTGADQRILACVGEKFPAESYFTNELLPDDPDAAWEPMDCDSLDQIRVAMSWILNDGEAPWYNAVELGFFADVCLEVQLVAGGPDVEPLKSLADGAVDIAVTASGSRVPAAVAGSNPDDIVAIGAFLKHSPYVWLGLDHDTPQDQHSNKKLTPQDFVGKRISLQESEDFLFAFFSSRYGISEDQVELVEETDFNPNPVLAGEVDYTGAWIVNEPRYMEQKGFMNWVAFPFSSWGWDSYADVSVVRRATLEENPDLARRYLAALSQGIRFLLENPQESAEIALKYGVDAELTREQALRRFELQEPLIVGSDELPVSHMSAERWNAQVASMIQYDQLDLPACE